MRIGVAVIVAAVAAAGLAAPAAAFDPGKDLGTDTSPGAAYAFADKALRQGQEGDALQALEFAASRGHARAQWRLARMYADGEGVQRDDLKAYEYLKMLVNQHAEDNPFVSSARIVSESFVDLASYYLSGIPDTKISKNLDEARNLLTHAATYFGDAEAQYQLGEIYHHGRGVERSDDRAVSWLLLAAKKQHVEALGRLGQLLYTGGSDLRPRPMQGLKFLEVARRKAGPGNYPWIKQAHEEAFTRTSDGDRQRAMAMADDWLRRYSAP